MGKPFLPAAGPSCSGSPDPAGVRTRGWVGDVVRDYWDTAGTGLGRIPRSGKGLRRGTRGSATTCCGQRPHRGRIGAGSTGIRFQTVRSPGSKLKEGRFRLDIRRKFFPMRVVRPWPRLPRGAVAAPSLAVLKARLDRAPSSLG